MLYDHGSIRLPIYYFHGMINNTTTLQQRPNDIEVKTTSGYCIAFNK